MKKVIVYWKDITKTMNEDIFNDKIKISDRLSKMETIGYLYKEDDIAIMLVQEFSDGKIRDYVVIPKKVIISIRELK